MGVVVDADVDVDVVVGVVVDAGIFVVVVVRTVVVRCGFFSSLSNLTIFSGLSALLDFDSKSPLTRSGG